MTDLDFKWMTYPQLVNRMRTLRRETKRDMIPYGQKGKATWVGYRFACFGMWHVEKCFFRIATTKRISHKLYDEIQLHFQCNPEHQLQAYAEYDIPAYVYPGERNEHEPTNATNKDCSH